MGTHTITLRPRGVISTVRKLHPPARDVTSDSCTSRQDWKTDITRHVRGGNTPPEMRIFSCARRAAMHEAGGAPMHPHSTAVRQSQ